MDRNKIYHFDFSLTNPARGCFGQEGKITLYKAREEGFPHIIMKLVSYFWFYHPELHIEKKANQNWKPDLVRFNLRNQPVQWIDCGATTRHKLDQISTKNTETKIMIIKKSFSELRSYKLFVEKALKHPERVGYYAPDLAFIQQLSSKLRGRHNLMIYINDDMSHMYFEIDGELLETSIHTL